MGGSEAATAEVAGQDRARRPKPLAAPVAPDEACNEGSSDLRVPSYPQTEDAPESASCNCGAHVVSVLSPYRSNGTERLHGSTDLWLHPLPSTPSMDIDCAWPALDETRHTIDTTAIHRAAASDHWLWPEDAELPEI